MSVMTIASFASCIDGETVAERVWVLEVLSFAFLSAYAANYVQRSRAGLSAAADAACFAFSLAAGASAFCVAVVFAGRVMADA